MLNFVCYPKCSTCQKAQKWLEDNGALYQLRDIKQNNPTFEELEKWLKISGLPIKKFFSIPINSITDCKNFQQYFVNKGKVIAIILKY